MQNSKKLEKSNKTTGVLIFAFNTATVNYVALADQTSRLTKKHLGLPITLVTDFDAAPTFEYDQIIRIENKGDNFRMENKQAKEWRNFGRYLAYDLSPYDTTILIDGDYLVLDKTILNLLEQEFDYRLMHHSHNPKEKLYEKMSHYGIPFVWATVVIFRKSKLSEQFFRFIGRIQRNYNYYKTRFLGDGSYRNDYAFAISNLILSGYSLNEHKGIPWSMLTIEQPIVKLEMKNDFVVVRYAHRAEVIYKQNMHVMDKQFLTSPAFRLFVDEVCNESA